jgi:hypothetical protein
MPIKIFWPQPPLECARKYHQFINLNPKPLYAPGLLLRDHQPVQVCQEYHHRSSAVMSSLSQTAITRFPQPLMQVRRRLHYVSPNEHEKDSVLPDELLFFGTCLLS